MQEPLRIAILKQKPARPNRRVRRSALTEKALTVLFCILAALAIFVLVRATTSSGASLQVCGPGQCCVPCDDAPNFGSYELKAQVGPIPYAITSERFVGPVTLGAIRRLWVPDAPASSAHRVAFEVTGIPSQGGAPFHAVTSAGDWTMKLRGARWVVLNATKTVAGTPPDAASLPAYVCYGADTVRDAVTGERVARYDATWTDQFGAQEGSFGAVYTACFPANGTPGKPVLCLGDSRGVGRGPANVNLDTPVTDPLFNVDVDPLDDICLAVQ